MYFKGIGQLYRKNVIINMSLRNKYIILVKYFYWKKTPGLVCFIYRSMTSRNIGQTPQIHRGGTKDVCFSAPAVYRTKYLYSSLRVFKFWISFFLWINSKNHLSAMEGQKNVKPFRPLVGPALCHVCLSGTHFWISSGRKVLSKTFLTLRLLLLLIYSQCKRCGVKNSLKSKG
jgi:hypothetical protein